MRKITVTSRVNVMELHSIMGFAGIAGGLRQNQKDAYFVRVIGYSNTLREEIKKMDAMLLAGEQSGRGSYQRMQKLPVLVNPEEVKAFRAELGEWEKHKAMDTALQNVEDLFQRHTPNVSQAMCQNFLVKILFWKERIAGKILDTWDGKMTHKLVYTGVIKKQEYLFFYYLVQLGLDVLLIHTEGSLELPAELLVRSELIQLEQRGLYEIPEWNPHVRPPQSKRIAAENIRKPAKPQPVSNPVVQPVVQSVSQPIPQQPSKEMEFEELAKLASSVVMIAIHDHKGEVIGTGSGIMINDKGYILTNNHVAAGGRFYSVRMEESEEVYQTDEIIKYNQLLDLALLRIDAPTKGIPLYNGKKELVRGQKVVAIGSPLGLFNSVSDGIISGFRKLDEVRMIQFTAPISHGSSGGALLNMRGEVIGISTAGFEGGQNINLAVEYTEIRQFIRGFAK